MFPSTACVASGVIVAGVIVGGLPLVGVDDVVGDAVLEGDTLGVNVGVFIAGGEVVDACGSRIRDVAVGEGVSLLTEGIMGGGSFSSDPADVIHVDTTITAAIGAPIHAARRYRSGMCAQNGTRSGCC